MRIQADMKWNFEHEWQDKSIGYQHTQIGCKSFQLNTSSTSWNHSKCTARNGEKGKYNLGTALLI